MKFRNNKRPYPNVYLYHPSYPSTSILPNNPTTPPSPPQPHPNAQTYLSVRMFLYSCITHKEIGAPPLPPVASSAADRPGNIRSSTAGQQHPSRLGSARPAARIGSARPVATAAARLGSARPAAAAAVRFGSARPEATATLAAAGAPPPSTHIFELLTHRNTENNV